MLWYHQLLSPFMEYWYSHWINGIIINKICTSINILFLTTQSLSNYPHTFPWYNDWVKLKSFWGFTEEPIIVNQSNWISFKGTPLRSGRLNTAMRRNQVFNDSTKYWCDRNKMERWQWRKNDADILVALVACTKFGVIRQKQTKVIERKLNFYF